MSSQPAELSEGEVRFVNQRTFSIAAPVDGRGRPWASPLFGVAGADLFEVEEPVTVRFRARAGRCCAAQSADTVFLASQNTDHGAGATHRDGPPGFVTVVDEGTLAIHDHFGNGMFQTLGNLLLDDRVAATPFLQRSHPFAGSGLGPIYPRSTSQPVPDSTESTRSRSPSSSAWYSSRIHCRHLPW